MALQMSEVLLMNVLTVDCSELATILL